MFKWLAKWILKPLITPMQKAVGLCDKLVVQVDKLITMVNGLPLEQGFKDELISSATEAKNAIVAVKSVIVKVLEYIGADVPYA